MREVGTRIDNTEREGEIDNEGRQDSEAVMDKATDRETKLGCRQLCDMLQCLAHTETSKSQPTSFSPAMQVLLIGGAHTSVAQFRDMVGHATSYQRLPLL